MYRDTIQKDSLKVGDVVGIRKATKLGWSYFRYPRTFAMTIERITPARSKFIMTDGSEYTKNEPFYPITAESTNQTHIANCALKFNRSLNELEALRREGKLFTQNDAFIEKASDLLEQLLKEVQK